MLDAIPPELWSEWLVFRSVEMDPMLRLIGMVRSVALYLLHYHGIEVEAEHIDPGYDPAAGTVTDTDEAVAGLKANMAAIPQ